MVFQLNWLHDPTFAGEYLLDKVNGRPVDLREGGPNSFPVADVLTGRATVAVVGADIFLRTIEKEEQAKADNALVCFFVDFQRNPVGWVLHPDAAADAGLPREILHDQVALNQWLFQKLKDGVLQIGDKRGTETTSIWIAWRGVHNLPEQFPVIPVGFDTSIVLDSPSLAYPVYLNEEPFKLEERIGRPMVVFDPVADGIRFYGNVLVTSKEFAEHNPDIIRSLQAAMRHNWSLLQTDPRPALGKIASGYKGVTQAVLQRQLCKTLDFVFYKNQVPGAMDLGENGGWATTLRSLQAAGLVKPTLTLEVVKRHLIIPQL